MNEVKISLRMMSWKHKGQIIILSVSNLLLSCLNFEGSAMKIKVFILLQTMLLASYYDINFRQIPNWIHMLILILGVVQIQIVQSLFGFFLLPLPFLGIALFQEGSVGGGDVKLIGSLGFMLGLLKGVELLIWTLVFAIFFSLLYSLFKHKKLVLIPYSPFVYGALIIIIL